MSSQTVVQPGEDINFTLESEDLESGIAGTPVIALKRNTITYTEGIHLYLNYNPTTNKFEGTYYVPSNARNGEWYVSWIYIVDEGGNIFNHVPSEGSTYHRSFRVSDDIFPPDIPTVNEVTDKSSSVIGTAEIGSSITVKAGTTVLGTAKTTAEGKYSVTITKQKAGTTLTVTATDSAGNVSEVKEVTVKDVTAPTLPTVNEVTETTTIVTGTAEIGSSITVKAGTTVTNSYNNDRREVFGGFDRKTKSRNNTYRNCN